MKVEVLFFEGCPNHLPTVKRVRETLLKMGLHDDIHGIEVDSQDKAEATAFLTRSFGIRRFAGLEKWIVENLKMISGARLWHDECT